MINILTWDARQQNGAFQKSAGTYGIYSDLITEKPALSFEFVELTYIEQANLFEFIDIDSTKKILEAEKKAEILDYIQKFKIAFTWYKNMALANAKNKYEEKVRQLTGDTSQTEIASWKTQEEEAVNYLKDNTIPTPFLDTLMLIRTDFSTKKELCNKIIYKSTVYKQYYPLLLGEYHNAVKKIESANSLEELGDIK